MTEKNERGFAASELDEHGPVRGSTWTTAEEHAPRIMDPGGEGWAAEPKGITAPERLLYADLAGPVRLLGQAAVAASDAYSLVCKHSNEPHNQSKVHGGFADEEVETAYREAVQATWQLYENARGVHREIAAKAVSIARRFEQA